MTATAGGALEARVQALVALYQEIAATRMRGLPLLNPALRVQAVGFARLEPVPAGQSAAAPQPQPAGPASPAGARPNMGTGAAGVGADAEAALGILITPWFMNLVWLPLQRLDAEAQTGGKTARHVGRECFEFIGAHEDSLGGYAACSLFSPMFEFASQTAALMTAQAVLAHLRQPVLAPAPAPALTSTPVAESAAAPATLAPRAASVPATAVAPASAASASPAAPVPARRAFLFGRRPAAPGAAPPAAPQREAARRG